MLSAAMIVDFVSVKFISSHLNKHRIINAASEGRSITKQIKFKHRYKFLVFCINSLFKGREFDTQLSTHMTKYTAFLCHEINIKLKIS